MSEDKARLNDDNIIEGYEYDGITELDNPCPDWLMYIFILLFFCPSFSWVIILEAIAKMKYWNLT